MRDVVLTRCAVTVDHHDRFVPRLAAINGPVSLPGKSVGGDVLEDGALALSTNAWNEDNLSTAVRTGIHGRLAEVERASVEGTMPIHGPVAAMRIEHSVVQSVNERLAIWPLSPVFFDLGMAVQKLPAPPSYFKWTGRFVLLAP